MYHSHTKQTQIYTETPYNTPPIHHISTNDIPHLILHGKSMPPDCLRVFFFFASAKFIYACSMWSIEIYFHCQIFNSLEEYMLSVDNLTILFCRETGRNIILWQALELCSLGYNILVYNINPLQLLSLVFRRSDISSNQPICGIFHWVHNIFQHERFLASTLLFHKNSTDSKLVATLKIQFLVIKKLK